MKPDEGTDRDTLQDMLEACTDILTHSQATDYEQFLIDRPHRQAAAYCFAVLGEAVKRLTPDFRIRHSEIPWLKIAGMRDRLIHGYDTIQWRLLWEAATIDVPLLLKQLREIQSKLD